MIFDASRPPLYSSGLDFDEPKNCGHRGLWMRSSAKSCPHHVRKTKGQLMLHTRTSIQQRTLPQVCNIVSRHYNLQLYTPSWLSQDTIISNYTHLHGWVALHAILGAHALVGSAVNCAQVHLALWRRNGRGKHLRRALCSCAATL